MSPGVIWRRACACAILIGDSYRRGHALFGVSLWALYAGEVARARAWASEGANLSRSHGDSRYAALSSIVAGQAAQTVGDLAAAREHFSTAYAHAAQIGSSEEMAAARSHLATVALAQGNPQEARRDCAEAVALQRGLAPSPVSMIVLTNAADLLLKQGQVERAIQLLAFVATQSTTGDYTHGCVQALLAEAAAVLPSPTFDAAHAAGGQLALAQACILLD